MGRSVHQLCSFCAAERAATCPVDDVQGDRTRKLAEREEEGVSRQDGSSHLRHGDLGRVRQDRRADETGGEAVGHLGNEEVPPVLGKDLDDDSL